MYAGVAGGADVILIPEIPFTYDSVCGKVQEREAADKHFTLVIVAEGAREKGGEFVTAAEQVSNREARLGGIAAVVAAELEKRTGKEARPCVLGHMQPRWMSYQLRPFALHRLRRRSRRTDRRREVRADGRLSRLWSGIGEDYRSRREVEDGATRGRFRTNGTGIGNLSWRLGEN